MLRRSEGAARSDAELGLSSYLFTSTRNLRLRQPFLSRRASRSTLHVSELGCSSLLRSLTHPRQTASTDLRFVLAPGRPERPQAPGDARHRRRVAAGWFDLAHQSETRS